MQNNREKTISLLKEYQPTAWNVLSRALEKDQIWHACLFHGVKGSMKKEMAFLLAQALLMGKTSMDESANSDEEENIIRRVDENTYSSFIYIDGNRKKAISKDEIDSLESKFSRTGGEGNGRRVYIIEHLENSSIGAMNSLLKFLEEPGEETYAIITVDNMAAILETIRSRCVLIPFYPLPSSVYASNAVEEGLDIEDAYLLSNIVTNMNDLGSLVADEGYQTAKTMLKQYLDPIKSKLLLVDYELQYRNKKGSSTEGRDASLEILKMFYGMYIQYCHDIISGKETGISWYDDACANARSHVDYVKIYGTKLKIMSEERDLLNRNNDLNLILAQTIYRLEVKNK